MSKNEKQNEAALSSEELEAVAGGYQPTTACPYCGVQTNMSVMHNHWKTDCPKAPEYDPNDPFWGMWPSRP